MSKKTTINQFCLENFGHEWGYLVDVNIYFSYTPGGTRLYLSYKAGFVYEADTGKCTGSGMSLSSPIYNVSLYKEIIFVGGE